jgi:hypothetical protein
MIDDRKYLQKDARVVCTCLRFTANGKNDLKGSCSQFNNLQERGT